MDTSEAISFLVSRYRREWYCRYLQLRNHHPQSVMTIRMNQNEVLRKKMSRIEVPLLALAVVFVLLYLAWLDQLWKEQERLYSVVAGVIDSIFFDRSFGQSLAAR